MDEWAENGSVHFVEMGGGHYLVCSIGGGVGGGKGLVVLAGNRPQVGSTWCSARLTVQNQGELPPSPLASIGFVFIFGRFMTQCKIEETLPNRINVYI